MLLPTLRYAIYSHTIIDFTMTTYRTETSFDNNKLLFRPRKGEMYLIL